MKDWEDTDEEIKSLNDHLAAVLKELAQVKVRLANVEKELKNKQPRELILR